MIFYKIIEPLDNKTIQRIYFKEFEESDNIGVDISYFSNGTIRHKAYYMNNFFIGRLFIKNAKNMYLL